MHIGLHKTATSYLQNVLSAHRYDLLREGVLYPTTGAVGQYLRQHSGRRAVGSCPAHPAGEPPGARVRTACRDPRHRIDGPPVVGGLHAPPSRPEQYISRFSAFGSVQVVLVLRRQDVWIESYYKQIVDQYRKFETRSFDEFLAQMGPKLVDFHTRFSPWRDLVGPESFHVLSYDDLPGGAAICRRLLEIAGVGGSLLDDPESIPVPRYDSVRAIDTVGLRILNSYRLDNRDVRTRIAKSIYAAAPDGDIELMKPEMRDGIQALCAPINERIEAEWFKEPVPGFRFGAALGDPAASPPTGPEVIDYLDQVIALCEGARKSADERGSAK